MDSLIKQIDGIDWDKLTVDEARKLRAALRSGVEKSDAWFKALAEGFTVPAPSFNREQFDRAVTMNGGGPTPTPKRGRGRPPKAAVAAQLKHPPVGILQESYVSNAPDPSVPWTLPPGHPRANGGTGVPVVGDDDFAAMSSGKVEFN